MNAAEHIVECYFRLVRKCFTITDAKVIGGVNRQCDLLAANLSDGNFYHVESSVTHRLMWAPGAEDLRKVFDKKFRGVPKKSDRPNSEWMRGINYLQNIQATYRSYGIDPRRIKRVFVCWIVKGQPAVNEMLQQYRDVHGLRVEVLSFKHVILPELDQAVGTSNYGDEILRTISLFKQQKSQSEPEEAEE